MVGAAPAAIRASANRTERRSGPLTAYMRCAAPQCLLADRTPASANTAAALSGTPRDQGQGDSLHRADSHAAGECALEDEEEGDGGQDAEQSGGGLHRHVDDVFALRDAEGERDGLVLVGDQEDQGEQELVPGP